jgi:two-component system alkaline phosphatase synthesis response regulator PhoP
MDLVSDESKTLIAGCSVNFNSFEVVDKNNEKVSLTNKQIKLLKLFVDKKNEVISRQEILEKIWGYDVYPSSRTIDNFILVFRKVFEKNLPASTHFKSIRGVGYKFTP